MAFEFSWSLPYGAWMVLGAALLGALPTFALARFRLVGPALVVGTTFVWSAVETWAAVTSPYPPISITPFSLSLLGWFAVLVIAGVVGGIEYVLRRRFGGSRPWPGVPD